MSFSTLEDFLKNRMRMSQVYQPVMIKVLLDHDGSASVADIARALLGYDQSQIEYYQTITNNMVGRVLRRHGIVSKDGSNYRLEGFGTLSREERERLRELCEEKVAAYIERRGHGLWDHRRRSTGYVTGTLRYEVFKRAGFHCELCGVRADEVALQVDHILPRNRGGSDDISNLQALCYSCNAMKRDRDDVDFRAVRASFEHREPECIFCELPSERIVNENELAVVIRDGFPVTPGHSLVIPKRHVATYFELAQSEVNAVTALLQTTQAQLSSDDPTIAGFNIGMNNGSAAGQTIFHCHIHLIPRRPGDVDNPRGGVRHIIPGKGDY